MMAELKTMAMMGIFVPDPVILWPSLLEVFIFLQIHV